jgi:hypothetical protein
VRAADAGRYALSSMNPIEQIDSHEYLYLSEMSEPDVNVLRIVIEEAKASQSETRTLEVGSAKLSELRPIVADESCQGYEIMFGTYVAIAFEMSLT